MKEWEVGRGQAEGGNRYPFIKKSPRDTLRPSHMVHKTKCPHITESYHRSHNINTCFSMFGTARKRSGKVYLTVFVYTLSLCVGWLMSASVIYQAIKCNSLVVHTSPVFSCQVTYTRITSNMVDTWASMSLLSLTVFHDLQSLQDFTLYYSHIIIKWSV